MLRPDLAALRFRTRTRSNRGKRVGTVRRAKCAKGKAAGLAMIKLHGRFAALSPLAAVLGIVDAQDATSQPSKSEPVQPSPPLATPSPSESAFAGPTASPTETRSPSVAPSEHSSLWPSASADPTAEPSRPPTLSPTKITRADDVSDDIVERLAEQTLVVTVATEFTDVQQGIYCSLLSGYTVNFGLGIGPEQIITECTVTQQRLASGRRRGFPRSVFGRKQRGLQTSSPLLNIYFTMTYETKFGHDIEEYPRQFQDWVNGNLSTVTRDMVDRFLPVQEAKEVYVVAPPKEPTKVPTRPVEQTENPSMSPSFEGPSPSLSPTNFPTTTRSPSYQPSEMNATNAPVGPGNDRTSFVVGLAAGLGGAASILFFLICYMRQKNRKRNEEALARSTARANESVSAETGIAGQNPREQYNDRSEYGATSPPVTNSIYSNPSMVSGGGSFSSQSEENNANDVQVKQLQEEFDIYKSKDLENMGDRVDGQVHGSDGMMSLAMTRALMEDEDATNPSWGGAEDPESIEANGLCEANDWLRKHDNATVDQGCVAKLIDALGLLVLIQPWVIFRHAFFQEITNRMVATVRHGRITPDDGTRAIHCIAELLGLKLEQELPNNVILVTGMRKEMDLSRGRYHLMEAFKPFGEIESAAIAPSNRGFGGSSDVPMFRQIQLTV
ncbi:hypothetical protein THAOC_32704 [Thalassiosira oceanica]|uniref:Uncharacterized protein n=1 Tax=Thalassiosira oceanica TaxID=159749 RepID=K0RP17_THAOC|nr:hypothetical protein THAOC_32704 [Thalassiosira oceanica]|eukprot:EJK48492.1 hypothetical protein THAOC_32704 [Thalassiosira oceanica]